MKNKTKKSQSSNAILWRVQGDKHVKTENFEKLHYADVKFIRTYNYMLIEISAINILSSCCIKFYALRKILKKTCTLS